MHMGVGVGCVCASRLCGARATEQNGLGHSYNNAALAGVWGYWYWYDVTDSPENYRPGRRRSAIGLL